MRREPEDQEYDEIDGGQVAAYAFLFAAVLVFGCYVVEAWHAGRLPTYRTEQAK